MSQRSETHFHEDHAETGPAEPESVGEDAEFEEIDRLYRQALETVDALDVAPKAEDASPAGQNPPEPSLESGDVETGPAATPGSTSDEARIRIDPVEDFGTGPAVSPRQVIEAALFVGGQPLTVKKLCGLLRGDFDAEFVQRTIDGLNGRYHRENRPYEIRFGDGGYRMRLRSEFATVRDRVYGLGPKEVRLSQEALEVLALVAYQQPITREEMERTIERKNVGGLLRQLLRRELIALQRDADDPQEVRYHTTPRFLELFGIGGVDELPRAEELSFK